MSALENFKAIKPGETIFNKSGLKMTVTSAKDENGVFTLRIREDSKVYFQFDERKSVLKAQGNKEFSDIGIDYTKPQKYSYLIIGHLVELSDGRKGRVVGTQGDMLKVAVKDEKRPALTNFELFKFNGKGKGSLKISKEVGW